MRSCNSRGIGADAEKRGMAERERSGEPRKQIQAEARPAQISVIIIRSRICGVVT